MFIKDALQSYIKDVLHLLYSENQSVDFSVQYPVENSYGDYSSNVALVLGKKISMNPFEVAQKIVDALEKNKLTMPFITKIEIVRPGFINFFLSPLHLLHEQQHIILHEKDYGKSDYKKGKIVVTDISHPNIAKPMGVHHLLSTIIGNSINRILAAVGYKVVRDNYLGDWGTQYGKLIWAYKNWGDEGAVKKNPIPELLKLYVRFHEEAEKNPALEEFGRMEFKKLEEGHFENRKLWQWIVDLSLKEFHAMWQRLDVEFDFIHGESFYEDKMQEIIDMGIQKGLFVEGEKGALIYPFKHEKYPPCIIRKSDGATIYATRDLARTKYWEDTWHPDLMIIVADTAQELHFKQFFEVAAALGITNAPNIHAWFGRMSFPEKRMSTRKGNIILMEELLDEAEDCAYEVVKEKNPELSEEKRRAVGRMIGIGAVKYAVLAQNRQTNIVFTWEKMLSLDGNSAPYIQYAYARAWSILRNAGITHFKELLELEKKAEKSLLSEPAELLLARLIVRLPEILTFAADELKPNLLTNYLFQVASQFNTFYSAVNVLKSDDDIKKQRLMLIGATSIVLRNGLQFLGIEAPNEM